MSIYVDIHVLQTVPPSCVNRDDMGSPKTAIYGGTRRARISSQAYKYAMRKDFKKIFSEEELGVRSHEVAKQIAKEIVAIDSTISEEEAIKKATKALNVVEIKTEAVKKKDDTEENDKIEQTKVLLFISNKSYARLQKTGNSFTFLPGRFCAFCQQSWIVQFSKITASLYFEADSGIL